jgi:hypothetical protein
LNTGSTLTTNNTITQPGTTTLSFNGGLYHFQTLSFAGQGFFDMSPIQSSLVQQDLSGFAAIRVKTDAGTPYAILEAQGPSGHYSAILFRSDTMQWKPNNGYMSIDSLSEFSDTTANKPMTWNPTTGRWGWIRRWAGSGSGGGGPDALFGSPKTVGFDTLSYFPSWDLNVIMVKDMKFTGLNSIAGSKVITDSTIEYIAQLVNDQSSPGANKVYGTDGSGVKGWKSDPTGGGGLSGMTAGRIQIAASASALVDYSNLTWDNTNKRVVLTGADADWNGKAGIEMVNTTGDKRIYLFTSNYDFRITSNFFGTNGIISMNGQGDDIKISNAYPGAMILAPNTVEQFRIAVDGKVTVQTLKTSGSAPTTSGTTKMVITDANGLQSFADIPSSGFTNPMTTLGDIIYGGSAGAGTRLAGNTTATKKFLTQTGTGSVSAAPSWGTLVSGDIPDLSATYIKNQSTAQTSSQFYVDGQSRIDNELLINTVDIGAYKLQLNGGFYNKINSGDNWVVEATGSVSLFATYQSTGSGGTGFFIKSGDGASLGSKFSYVDFWNYDATEQRWDLGTYGTNNFTLRDRTNSLDALVVTPSTGNIKTLYTGSGNAIAQFDASGNFSRGVDPATLQAVTYDIFNKGTVTTTDATATSIADVTIPNNTAGTIEVNWIAIKSDGTQGYGSIKNFSFRKTSGTLTIDATGQSLYSSLNEITASSQFASSGISVNSNNLRIFVQGVPSTTVKWKAVYKINYVN